MSWSPSMITSGSTIGTRPLLAQRGMARQRVRAHRCGCRRDVPADVDHRAPLGEARAPSLVSTRPGGRAGRRGPSVTTSPGSRPAWVPLSTLMPGIMPLSAMYLERDAGLGRLADGLVEQDRAGQVLVGVQRGQQQLAVGAAVLFGVLDADAGEALVRGRWTIRRWR